MSTSFVSATQVTAVVHTPQLTTPGPVLVTAASSAGTSNAVSVTVLERGDINGNRSVNIGDALACALTVGGINKPAIPNTVGDLNLNGSTNIGDCLVLALFSVRVNANLALPSVTSVSPGTPNPGDTLTVTGTGFSPAAAGNQVLFEAMGGGATRVTPSSATTTSLTVTVPSDATSGAIQVYRRDAALAGNEFPLTVNGTATPLALMTVSPFSGVARGANVTLRGLGFGTTPAEVIPVVLAALDRVAKTQEPPMLSIYASTTSWHLLHRLRADRHAPG